MGIAKIVLASSMLLTLVSCGNDSKSKSGAPAPQVDSIVQSYDWKIINSNGFPAEKLMVELSFAGNTETLVNECQPSKSDAVIERTSVPNKIVLTDYLVPTGAETVSVKIMNCEKEEAVLEKTVGFELNKSGTVGEVIVNL